MKQLKKHIVCLLAILFIFTVMFPISSFADGWDGEGLTPGTTPEEVTSSYYLPYGTPEQDLLGYRFSIYDGTKPCFDDIQWRCH